MPHAAMIFLLLVSSVGLNAMAQVFLRSAMRNTSSDLIVTSLSWWWDRLTSWGVLAGLGCYVVSFILWLIVLSKVQVSIAYPFQALGYVFASIIAWRVLGEGLTPLNVLGIALICAGVVVLAQAHN